jgi:hypothetical protein
VINRMHDTDLLFQRLEATRSGPRDPGVERVAASAIKAWPLLARLAPRAETPSRPEPIPVELGEPWEDRSVAETVPVLAPEPAAPRFHPEPAPVGIAPASPLSPLDQLFARLDRVAVAKATPTDGAPSAGRVVALRPALKDPQPLDARELARLANEEAAMRLFEKMARS